MENEHRLQEQDLETLLHKKSLLIQEILECTTKQLGTLDLIAMGHFFDQKNQLMEQVLKIDSLIEMWQKSHQREANSVEQGFWAQIEKMIYNLSDLEEQLMTHLEQEKETVSFELSKLQDTSKIKGYLTAESNVGEKLSLKR